MKQNVVPIAVGQYLRRGFIFLRLKTDYFLRSDTFLKKRKLKGKHSENLGQNICRLIHVLTQFLFSTSEMKLDFCQQKNNVRIASQVIELRKTQDLRKLVSFKKIIEMPGFAVEYSVSHRIAKF